MKNNRKLLLLLAALFTSFWGISQQSNKTQPAVLWTVQDKEVLIKGLERTRYELLKEINGLSEKQWSFKEDSSRWSILEIVEHLVLQNESYRSEMRTALGQPELPQFVEKTKGNDSVFIKYATDTLKADAGFLTPIDRFCNTEKAALAFNKVQDLLIDMVTNSNKDFRKHFTFRNFVQDNHLSNAEKYNVRDMHQLMLTCISHADRHLQQLRKVKAHPIYPAL